MRGRKPTATAVKRARGSYAHDPQRENKREPIAPEGEPIKPDYLDEIGGEKWDSLVELFREMGMLSRADSDLLEAYCVNYSSYRRALVDVNRTGQVTEEDGELKRNPYSVELHKYMDRMTKLLSEMGLTPSSRSRVVAPEKKENDPFDEWLKAKHNLEN